MFNRHKSHSKPLQIDTLIGAGTRIAGDVQFAGGLHLDGTIEGNVGAQAGQPARLSVSNSGSVRGSVNVPNVVLNGSVQGDIIANVRLDLGSTAKVNGDVYYGLLEMAMGAQITGKLVHQSATLAATLAPDTASIVVDITSTGKAKLG